MKILVTGGSGFIGSHVVDVLAARGHQPVIFDLVQSPHHARGSVPTVIGDVTKTDSLAAAMKGCDAVVHLAAMADVNHVQADPEGAERLNSRATLAVLEAARRAGVGRVVYGSTIWAYSDCAETAVDEDTRVAPPGHLYTATKVAGEYYCRSYAELYGVDYTVLRFGIPYGPRARDATVLAAFVNKALGGEPLTVAGDGSQGRRFVYVEDLADGVERALAPAAANRIYNLAGSETTTIKQIAETVRELVGDAEIVHTEARAGDFGGKEVSSERALAELGWQPRTPFAEGARRYVAWRRERDAAPPERFAALRDRVGALASWRPARAALRPVVTAVLVTGAFFWSFASDDGFKVWASLLPGTRPVTAVDTASPQVGLIVDAPPAVAADVARQLHRDGASASIVLDRPAPNEMLAAIRGVGSDTVPRLRPGGPVRWVGTRSQLHHQTKQLGIQGHFYYATPGKGFTLAQDLLGHTAGGSPVAPAAKIGPGTPAGALQRGELLEVAVADAPGWRAWVDAVCRQIRARGLTAVSAQALLRSGPADR